MHNAAGGGWWLFGFVFWVCIVFGAAVVALAIVGLWADGPHSLVYLIPGTILLILAPAAYRDWRPRG